MPKFIRRIIIALVLFFLGVGVLGWYLSPRDDPEKVDAIVAISGGDTKARTDTAVILYKEGWSTRIIFAGAASDPNSPSNATVMRRIAVASGVPESSIIVEDYSRDTKENANNVANIFDTKPSSIILVTSPYHQRRAYVEFSKSLPDTKIINYPAFDQTWRRSLWWINPWGWYLTISESIKLLIISL